jgi:pilus assembly protein CpaB
LNAIVSPGKRAFTVATDTETAVAGLLQPGNYVDIIVTIRPENPDVVGAKWVAKTILQGIKVLAVGNSMSAVANVDPKAKNQPPPQTRNIKPSITLELLPDEAEQLALASSQGDLHVTLRTDTDFTQIENQGVTTAARIIGVTGSGAPQPPVEVIQGSSKPVVETANGTRAEVIEGGTSTEVTFQPDGTTTQKVTTPKRPR